MLDMGFEPQIRRIVEQVHISPIFLCGYLSLGIKNILINYGRFEERGGGAFRPRRRKRIRKYIRLAWIVKRK